MEDSPFIYSNHKVVESGNIILVMPFFDEEKMLP
jgi:hypothetical protein